MEIVTLISSLPNLPLFFSKFFVIYLTAHLILFRNWNSKLRAEAASCLISLAHGTPAVILACKAILDDVTYGFASTNTDFQNSVLEYSIAYFLMDLCHYVVFNPNDVLFIGHHLATLFVFLTCRYLVVHGAYGILVLLILAEVTSLFQNVWTLASALKSQSKVADQVFDVMSPPFYAFYSVVRGFLGPFFVYKMVVFYISGDADYVIPRWVWVSWIIVVVGAISVSILWICNRWIELYRERIAIYDMDQKIR
ncbi:TLC domain-containing protein At5g14285-like [Rutidosis leptorrhynchoides]|uniref:TLC domain-containing protein At5g14285-like n=1 Tax=Rutidosis leptorrhynchoides TaxID=125765 RepID=UPI003A99111E